MQEVACPVSLSLMSSGMDGQAARQRPHLGLGVHGSQLWSPQEAGAHNPPKAWAGACGPTGQHMYCNPSYKAGTLFLACAVKYYMQFLSLQDTTKSLNHS